MSEIPSAVYLAPSHLPVPGAHPEERLHGVPPALAQALGSGGRVRIVAHLLSLQHPQTGL